LKLEISK